MFLNSSAHRAKPGAHETSHQTRGGSIATDLERRPDALVALRRVDARSALAPNLVAHCFRICQGTRTTGGPGGIEVPTIWHGCATPLVHLSSTAAAFRTEMRLRVTYLSASAAADEWRALRQASQRLADLICVHDRSQVDGGRTPLWRLDEIVRAPRQIAMPAITSAT